MILMDWAAMDWLPGLFICHYIFSGTKVVLTEDWLQHRSDICSTSGLAAWIHGSEAIFEYRWLTCWVFTLLKKLHVCAYCRVSLEQEVESCMSFIISNSLYRHCRNPVCQVWLQRPFVWWMRSSKCGKNRARQWRTQVQKRWMLRQPCPLYLLDFCWHWYAIKAVKTGGIT